MSVDTSIVHTNAAYLPDGSNLNAVTEHGYWLAEWPGTVRGLAVQSDKTAPEVARELTVLAGERYGLDPDEIITEYAATLGR